MSNCCMDSCENPTCAWVQCVCVAQDQRCLAAVPWDVSICTSKTCVSTEFCCKAREYTGKLAMAALQPTHIWANPLQLPNMLIAHPWKVGSVHFPPRSKCHWSASIAAPASRQRSLAGTSAPAISATKCSLTEVRSTSMTSSFASHMSQHGAMQLMEYNRAPAGDARLGCGDTAACPLLDSRQTAALLKQCCMSPSPGQPLQKLPPPAPPA